MLYRGKISRIILQSTRSISCATLLAAVLIATLPAAFAQYAQTTLVTTTQDSHLVNAWGLAYSGTGPFWVSDEGTGFSTVYDANGTIVPLVVTIPPASTGKGKPTGIVANTTTGFVITQNSNSGPASFLFATEDGTISGWNSTVNATEAVIAVNNSATADYQGLTIATVAGNTFLYAANVTKNRIEQFNSSFHLVRTFTDSKLTGLKVYGVQAIKGKIYVTFKGSTGAAVDVFSTSGKLISELIVDGTAGPLADPWGVALAPASFGTFSNALLVGNVDQGTINAFNATTGAFIGTMTDSGGQTIVNPGLWGMVFGGGSTDNGSKNQLFITAGTSNYKTGLFAVINAQ